MIMCVRVICTVVEAALVRHPLNTAVVQGSEVTLECGSNVSNAFILWCYDVESCPRSNPIYNGYARINNELKFNVTKVNSATHVVRDLIIKSAELTDAKVYRCDEHIDRKTGAQDSNSAQVIVLGNHLQNVKMKVTELA